MTFSPAWDGRYRAATHLSVWPWSDVISSVMRYYAPIRPGLRVLEIGCGAGANIPFFQRIGAQYYGMEGSPFIVHKLQKMFPALKRQLITGDFTKQIPFKGPFDLVVDRSSLTHNTTASIKQCLEMIHDRLVPKGLFIGIDWFSTDCPEYKEGFSGGDRYTRQSYSKGRFAEVGRVHFSDRRHITELFNNFEIRSLEKKIIRKEIPKDDRMFALWNVVAQKPVRSL